MSRGKKHIECTYACPEAALPLCEVLHFPGQQQCKAGKCLSSWLIQRLACLDTVPCCQRSRASMLNLPPFRLLSLHLDYLNTKTMKPLDLLPTGPFMLRLYSNRPCRIWSTADVELFLWGDKALRSDNLFRQDWGASSANTKHKHSSTDQSHLWHTYCRSWARICLSHESYLYKDIHVGISNLSEELERLRNSVLSQHSIPVNTKLVVYDAVVMPFHINIRESWTLYRTHIWKNLKPWIVFAIKLLSPYSSRPNSDVWDMCSAWRSTAGQFIYTKWYQDAVKANL